jgi:hypothetical protein
VSLLGGGCSSERGVTPPPVKYNVYVNRAVTGGEAIDVIDAEADTVYHRTPFTHATRFEASPDGKYLAWYSGGDPGTLTLLDGTSFVTITSVQLRRTRAISLAFVGDPLQLLFMADDSTLIFEIPSLDVDTVWNRRLWAVRPTAQKGEMIAFAPLEDLEQQRYFPGIARIDVETGVVNDSFTLRCPDIPFPPCCGGWAVSPNGRRVYWISAPIGSAGSALFAFSVEDGSCIYQTPVEVGSGDVAVTPDGEEIWITQGGSSPPNDFVPTHLGYILILDANTGTPLDTIRTLGLRVDRPDMPLNLQEIIMHPTLSKAYVAGVIGQPGVLVINTKSRMIETTIYPGKTTYIYDIAIAPR